MVVRFNRSMVSPEMHLIGQVTVNQPVTKVNKIYVVVACLVAHFMIYAFILKTFCGEPHRATPEKNFAALCTFRYG